LKGFAQGNWITGEGDVSAIMKTLGNQRNRGDGTQKPSSKGSPGQQQLHPTAGVQREVLIITAGD
jgi:hypothetical protein